jgi:hypothetical protein
VIIAIADQAGVAVVVVAQQALFLLLPGKSLAAKSYVCSHFTESFGWDDTVQDGGWVSPRKLSKVTDTINSNWGGPGESRPRRTIESDASVAQY